MPFPRDRYARAGATPEQLDTLEQDYDALSPDAQVGYDARIAPLSDYGVAELLVEPVAEVEEADEPEEKATTTASTSSSGSASSGSTGASSAPSESSTGK